MPEVSNTYHIALALWAGSESGLPNLLLLIIRVKNGVHMCICLIDVYQPM